VLVEAELDHAMEPRSRGPRLDGELPSTRFGRTGTMPGSWSSPFAPADVPAEVAAAAASLGVRVAEALEAVGS